MNKYQANLDNAAQTLRDDSFPAVTTSEDTVSYKELNERIRDHASTLSEAGIRSWHRVLIVGNDMDIVSSIAWTWAVMYIGASAANADDSISWEHIELKAEAGNVDFIVDVLENEITQHKDDLVSFIEDGTGYGSKSHPEEKFILYSSGTTKKPDNIYGVEPQFFTYHKNWQGGIAHIDCLKLAYRFIGDVPIRQLACHPWEVAYAPHNVVNCLLSGGTYYWVEDPTDIPIAQKEYKTNMMSNYPLSFDPILTAWELDKDAPPIDFVETAGGICTPQLVERIRRLMKPRVISNSFISSKSGTILNRTMEENDPAENCIWMENPHLDPDLRLRLDDSNVLWYKRDGEWMTDEDVFERDGKYLRVVGKASEEYFQTEFGKVNAWEIEQFANQLTRMHWGCGEHTYCFPLVHMAGEARPGLVYSGPLAIERMVERMNELPDYKRPHTIYQVKPEFWALNIKVSRDFMSERLYKNQDYIENVAHCKEV
jgi:hypothetical protein